MITRKHLMQLLMAYGILSLIVFGIVPAVKAGERFYDETGKYQGQVKDNGRIYDERGRYRGRIERDRLYDDTGKYRGRVDSGVVVDENDQWTGATVRTENYYRMHKGYYPEDYE